MLTFEQMKELLDLVAAKKLGEVEVKTADLWFRVSGRETVIAAPVAVPAAAPAPAAEVAAPSPAAGAAPAGSADDAAGAEAIEGYVLTSPIVGTFYTAPSPDADPYVRPGERVEKGQVLCIVEAMKLMNEIESDVSGVVLNIFPQNSQPVEFGEPLFSIKTD